MKDSSGSLNYIKLFKKITISTCYYFQENKKYTRENVKFLSMRLSMLVVNFYVCP